MNRPRIARGSSSNSSNSGVVFSTPSNLRLQVKHNNFKNSFATAQTPGSVLANKNKTALNFRNSNSFSHVPITPSSMFNNSPESGSNENDSGVDNSTCGHRKRARTDYSDDIFKSKNVKFESCTIHNLTIKNFQ